MSFSYIFTANSSVVAGNPTRVSDYRILGRNTDAFRERFIIGHHFNNSGTTNEDGFHKCDYSNPLWFYAKATGTASYKYVGLWLEVNGASSMLRWTVQGNTAAPANATAGKAFAVVAQGGFTPAGQL